MRIGLTGNIGSGKSTVASILEELGAVVIDSDALARRASEEPEVLERIATELGPDLIREGRLDRAATADLVFGDGAARRRLEAIIHPWVRERSRQLERDLLDSASPPAAVVHDIPLLFETGMQGRFDAVVVVSAPARLRAERLAQRSGLSAADFAARDASQWPAERKRALADHVIENDGDLSSLREQVAAVWQEIVTSRTR